MPDLRAFKELIKISAFGGMNTNSPQGYVRASTTTAAYQWRPYSLENADFGRSPGWTAQPAASLQLTNVSTAVWAGAGDDLFVATAGNVFNYYDGFLRSLTAIAAVRDQASAVLLMPGLVMTTGLYSGTYSNQFIIKTGGTAQTAFGNSLTVAYTAPVAPEFSFNKANSYDFVLIGNQSGATGNPYFQGASYYKLTLAANSSTIDPYVPEFTNADQSIIGRVYFRLSGSAVDWQLGSFNKGAFVIGSGTKFRVVQSDLTATVPSGIFSDYVVPISSPSLPTAYHQSRVWIAGSDYRYFSPDRATTGIMTGGSPVRLLYSEVIATATLTSLPRFRLDNYIDVPFKVSKRIIAIKSAGRYLYVFGDRELFILTGNSDKDFQLESLGDSIGAIALGSVQRLGNSVYWLSDSGLMKAEGGNVTEVGEDIRPNLAALDIATLSSTVDFGREVYYVGDYSNKYCYFVREDSWTRRTDGLTAPFLYGGGTPYSYQLGGSLYALNGQRNNSGFLPGWLPIVANFSPHEFDGWNTRKEFRQLTLGYESIPGCSLQLRYFSPDSGLPATLNHTLPASTYAARSAFSFAMKGYSFGMTLTLSPKGTAGEVASLLRPPLSIYGVPEGEQA